MGHIVVSESHHKAAKTVASKHGQDLGTWMEQYLDKNPEIQAEINNQQARRK